MKLITSNPAHREKKQLVLENFGGVDFSSSPLNVAKNRASFACNLINDNGVNHKRPGWEEKYKLDGQINGIFEYVNGEYETLIVYAGTAFYHIVKGVATSLRTDTNFVDGKVQFFPHKEKVYIIGCGDYLVYGEFGDGYEIKPVADIAYVPTTSVNGKAGYTVKYYNPGESIGESQSSVPGELFDTVNLVTRKRKNTFIGERGISDQGDLPSRPGCECTCEYYTDIAFTLDGATSNGGKYYMQVEVQRANGSSDCKEVEIIVENNVGIGFSSTEDFSYNTSTGAKTTNVIFEFEAIEAAGGIDASYITECTFGTLFGAAGASDRLFLSGNPKYPNCDFYSEFDDYTYFTAQSQTVMGSDDVPITGYVRLSDNTLAVMKAGAVHEPSIYYRQATEVTVAEDERVKRIAFTKWSGGTGEGCVNPYTVASLAEDDLILSPNGVFGMVEVNNQRTNSRYMRERSRFINGKLLGEARLNDACAFVYKNRYYLAVPTDDERNGVCYVADPRHKVYRGDDIDGTFNYEWWYWENIPARCFAIIDGALWFGTADGRLCAFDDEFCDRTYDDITVSGNSTFAADEGYAFSFNGELDFSAGDEVIAEGTALYCEYLSKDEYTVKDGKIHYENAEIYSGTVVYADEVGNSGLAVGVAYTVKNVDRGEQTFELWNGKNQVVIQSGGFRLCRNMIGKTLYVKAVANGSVTLAEFLNGADLSIVSYGDVGISVDTLKICKKRYVCSRWYTPVFDLGATDMLKTMFGMTVTLEPEIGGEVAFGYETRDVERFAVAKGNKGFDFEEFSFEEFSFAPIFTSSYSIKHKQRKFNYIVFKFVSDNAYDCAVGNFKMIYTLNNRFRGDF